MDGLGQLIGGFGALGVVFAVLLGFLFLLLLPWLAIIECVRSRRDRNLKAVLVVLLVITWGLGSLFYGLFLTGSRGLRIFTLVALLLPLMILVPSVLIVGGGMKMAAEGRAEAERVEAEKLLAEFHPATLPVDAVEPFRALHFVSGAGGVRASSLARFNLTGPQPDNARDVDNRVRHVAHDAGNGRDFAVTDHEFGTIAPSSGRFGAIEVDASLGSFGYPAGVAWDSKHGRAIVVTSHVYTHFYRYDPGTADWDRAPAEFRDLSLVGLAYSEADDLLYAFERESAVEPVLRRIHRFNVDGASLGAVELDPPLPLPRRSGERIQLGASSGKLVAVLPPLESQGGAGRVFAIEPATGRVFVTE